MLEQPVPKDHTPWRRVRVRQPSGRPHSGGVIGALSAAGAGKDLLSMRKKEQQRWCELTTVPIPSVPAPETHKWDTGDFRSISDPIKNSNHNKLVLTREERDGSSHSEQRIRSGKVPK